MGFNKRRLEDQRRQLAEKEVAGRRATDAQVLEDAERLITAWNERQAKHMPMLFSPTIGAAIAERYWWVRCSVWLDHDARSTLTTLNRGSRSTWMSKTKPSGQVGSARRSATVFAVTGIPCSTSTRMLSRYPRRSLCISSIVLAEYRDTSVLPTHR
jgi:hypothetical protein